MQLKIEYFFTFSNMFHGTSVIVSVTAEKTNFSSVLPISQVGYYTVKPIESAVYCFYKKNFKMFHFSMGLAE